MERKAAREIKRQQVASKLAANKTSEDKKEADRVAHEAAMAANLGQHAMTTTLAAGTINEKAIATKMTTSTPSLGARGAEHMHD